MYSSTAWFLGANFVAKLNCKTQILNLGLKIGIAFVQSFVEKENYLFAIDPRFLVSFDFARQKQNEKDMI